MKVFICLVALLGICYALPTGQVAASKKVVCYFGSWSVYRHGNGKFDVEDIDPRICTHVMFGFTGLNENGEMVALDPYNDLEENWGKGAMKRFTRLRQQNPELKAILAVGGWNEGSEKYSRMARTAESRRRFINSVLPFLEAQEFDGLDVDWEYPANREGSNPEDKENFVRLLTELRAEFDQRGYLLTGAVSAGVSTIATAYDIPRIASLLDFISVMAYDFHGAWEKFTGHHAALYGNSAIDLGDNITLNADHAIRYWIENGAPPEKLVLGMGAYGRGFILDGTDNGLYAPASNGIDAGPYTGTAGFWGYNEIVEKMNAQQGQWTVVTEPSYKTPYAYNGRYWIGYDSQESVVAKANYIKELGLGGGMMWSIDTDDFKGFLNGEKFVLTKTLYRELNGELPPTQPTTTEDPNIPRTSTTTTTAAPPPPNDICEYVGLNPDPLNDCTDLYYSCVINNGQWVSLPQRCPGGIVFNPATKNCDYRENVEGCNN